jgi:uncharacterized protein (TIGR02300 family)
MANGRSSVDDGLARRVGLAKAEWGTKRVCQSCSTRFYDLMRTPCVCPKCQSVVETEVVFKPRRQSSAEARAAKAVPVAAELRPKAIAIEGDELEVLEGEDVEAVVVDAEDEEEGLMEDVADLGEDDDDMAEVMEHLDEDLQGEA